MWPIWHLGFVFSHNRRFGAPYVFGLILSVLIPIYVQCLAEEPEPLGPAAVAGKARRSLLSVALAVQQGAFGQVLP
jgi:hypothetical protein